MGLQFFKKLFRITQPVCSVQMTCSQFKYFTSAPPSPTYVLIVFKVNDTVTVSVRTDSPINVTGFSYQPTLVYKDNPSVKVNMLYHSIFFVLDILINNSSNIDIYTPILYGGVPAKNWTSPNNVSGLLLSPKIDLASMK